MDSFRNIYSQLSDLSLNIAFVFFIWGLIDNYFLIRYSGKLNRGFTVWKTPLNDSEKQFLFAIKEDIEEKTKIGPWRTKTSFIMVKDGEILVRYSNPGQNTSWPVVGYVDTTSPDAMLEYRLSIPMMAATIIFASAYIYIFLFFLAIFVICWFIEIGGLRKYLSQKAERYIVRKTSILQKGIS